METLLAVGDQDGLPLSRGSVGRSALCSIVHVSLGMFTGALLATATSSTV